MLNREELKGTKDKWDSFTPVFQNTLIALRMDIPALLSHVEELEERLAKARWAMTEDGHGYLCSSSLPDQSGKYGPCDCEIAKAISLLGPL